MKKLITIAACIIACIAFGRPGPGPGFGPRAPHHHHHHHSVWGRGGSHFWPGFTGALIGSLAAPVVVSPAPPPPPVVISSPRRVWIPPVYGERPVYRAGFYVGVERYIITPGYWSY